MIKTFRIGAPLGMLGKSLRTRGRSRSGHSRVPSNGSTSTLSTTQNRATNNSMTMGRGETISVANNINRVLNGYTSKVVKAIEVFYRCRVLSLSANYIVDEDGTAWLGFVRDVNIGRNGLVLTNHHNRHNKNAIGLVRYSSNDSNAQDQDQDHISSDLVENNLLGKPSVGTGIDKSQYGTLSSGTGPSVRYNKQNPRKNYNNRTATAGMLTSSQSSRLQWQGDLVTRVRNASTAGDKVWARQSALAQTDELPVLPKRHPLFAERQRKNQSQRQQESLQRKQASNSISSYDHSTESDTKQNHDVREAALVQAARALDKLSRKDVTELRSCVSQ